MCNCPVILLATGVHYRDMSGQLSYASLALCICSFSCGLRSDV